MLLCESDPHDTRDGKEVLAGRNLIVNESVLIIINNQLLYKICSKRMIGPVPQEYSCGTG